MQNKHQKNAYPNKTKKLLNGVFSAVVLDFRNFFYFGITSEIIYKNWPTTPFFEYLFGTFSKNCIFGIFEHVTSKKFDVRPKNDVSIDVNLFYFFSKMFKIQNKHPKNAYPTKNIQVLNGVFSGVLDLEILYKFSFWHNFRNNLSKLSHHPFFRVLFRHFF